MDGEREFRDALAGIRSEFEVVDHLARLFAAESIAKAWSLHTEVMRRYGFDRLVYIYSPLSRSFGALEDCLVLHNVPEGYIAEYLRQGHWRLPYFLSRAEAEGLDCMPWHTPPTETMSASEARAFAFRRSYGMLAGYSIDLGPLTANGRAGIGLCARIELDQDAVDRVWARHGQTIRVLNKALHLRVCTLPHEPEGAALSPRQREVLEWVSAGKSTRDIAILMNVTVATVEKHLRLARERLGAETTAEALMKATVRNQILRLDFSVARRKTPRHE